MPNLATVLRAETARLAKKEAKALVAPLKKSNTQYRRDIAALKRELRSVKRELDFLSRRERKRIEKPVPAAQAQGKRFSPVWLKAHRERLGLSAADYAELIGVSGQTIYNWEQGKSTPRQAQLASLASIRRIGKREAERMLEG